MRTTALVAAVALVLTSSNARADEGDEARAQALFDEGVSAMDAGRFDEACPKLAESMRLQSAGGTLLNLAYCHERTNRLVLAARTYEEAARMAEAEGRTARQTQATQRRAKLLDRIPRVVVSPPPARLAEVELELDGSRDPDLERSEDGRSLVVRIDPGTHTLVVRSRLTSRSVASSFVAREGESSTVVVDEHDLASVPALAPATSTATAASFTRETPAPRTGPPMSAIVLGGIGLGSGIAGAVFGVLAANEHADSERLCSGGCTHDALDAERRADTLAWGSNLAFGGAIVALGVGTALWLLQR